MDSIEFLERWPVARSAINRLLTIQAHRSLTQLEERAVTQATFTLGTASKAVNVSKSTVLRSIRAGRLSATRLERAYGRSPLVSCSGCSNRTVPATVQSNVTQPWMQLPRLKPRLSGSNRGPIYCAPNSRIPGGIGTNGPTLRRSHCARCHLRQRLVGSGGAVKRSANDRELAQTDRFPVRLARRLPDF
jgi:excisionase family DNA binding protein